MLYSAASCAAVAGLHVTLNVLTGLEKAGKGVAAEKVKATNSHAHNRQTLPENRGENIENIKRFIGAYSMQFAGTATQPFYRSGKGMSSRYIKFIKLIAQEVNNDLTRTARLDEYFHRLEQELYIESQAPVVDVFQIKVHPFIDVGDVVSAGNLPQARQTAFDRQFAAMPRLEYRTLLYSRQRYK
jgi:hypothetical protein